MLGDVFEWGQLALTNMVEIYLNPDNDNLWEEAEGNMALQDKILAQTAEAMNALEAARIGLGKMKASVAPAL